MCKLSKNSISIFNVRINPLDLTIDQCEDIKDKLDYVFGSTLKNFENTDLANSYSRDFEDLIKTVHEVEKLTKEKEYMIDVKSFYVKKRELELKIVKIFMDIESISSKLKCVSYSENIQNFDKSFKKNTD